MTSHLLDDSKLEELAESLGDMVTMFLSELIDSLEREVEQSIAMMRTAVSNDDAEALQQAAHRLKGSCANLGAKAAADLCLDLENLASQDSASLLPFIDHLEATSQESIIALRNYSF